MGNLYREAGLQVRRAVGQQVLQGSQARGVRWPHNTGRQSPRVHKDLPRAEGRGKALLRDQQARGSHMPWPVGPDGPGARAPEGPQDDRLRRSKGRYRRHRGHLCGR